MAAPLERPQAALPVCPSGIYSREGGNRWWAPPRTRLSGVTLPSDRHHTALEWRRHRGRHRNHGRAGRGHRL